MRWFNVESRKQAQRDSKVNFFIQRQMEQEKKEDEEMKRSSKAKMHDEQTRKGDGQYRRHYSSSFMSS